jgi:serine protease Do
MDRRKVSRAVVVLLGVVSAAALSVRLDAQSPNRSSRRPDGVMFSARGARIGVVVRDLDAAEAARQSEGGVIVEDVRPNSPAEKAGLKRTDVITEYDGERVRSAEQFSRLVHEAPSGRSVKATIVREGKKSDITLSATNDERQADVFIDTDRLREQMRDIVPNFNLDFDFPGRRARLGATVEELTPQLAAYFGAKAGVLVSSVADDSPAARAGLKAGDVIVSIDGHSVESSRDLLRVLRDVNVDHEVVIAIVRDKRESSVKAKLERPQPRRETRRLRSA